MEKGVAIILCNERKKTQCYAHLKRVDIPYMMGRRQVLCVGSVWENAGGEFGRWRVTAHLYFDSMIKSAYVESVYYRYAMVSDLSVAALN